MVVKDSGPKKSGMASPINVEHEYVHTDGRIVGSDNVVKSDKMREFKKDDEEKKPVFER